MTDKTKIELPKPHQKVRIRALKDGFRRAGIAHTAAGVDHAHDAFNEKQLEALHADPNLIVSYIEPAKADKGK